MDVFELRESRTPSQSSGERYEIDTVLFTTSNFYIATNIYEIYYFHGRATGVETDVRMGPKNLLFQLFNF